VETSVPGTTCGFTYLKFLLLLSTWACCSRARDYEKRMDIDPLAKIPGPKGSDEVDVEDSAARIPYTTKA
jgi:hypothetical protein